MLKLPPVRRLSQALLLLVAALASGCASGDHQSIFDTKGPVAAEQLDVTMVTLWVSVGIFVVVGSALVYAVVRFRAPSDLNPESPLPPQTHGNAFLEMVLTATAVGLLVIIAVPTLRTIFKLDRLPTAQGGEQPLIVTVRGYQWWFSFTYENTAKKVVTANELRIPTGKPVILRLESSDVIHSFWVPKLAGKVDMIPNQHNQMWLQAEEQGYYLGQCAEYCGTSHANMRFRVVTMYPDEFNRWITHQDQPAVEPPAGSLAAQGKEIFIKGPKNGQACSSCHAIKGTDAAGVVGPNLTHVASRLTLAAGILDNSDADLKRWLHDPEGVKPGNRMAGMALPPLKLSDDEVNALAAYLETLK